MLLNIQRLVDASNPPEVINGSNLGTGSSAQIEIKGDDRFGLISVFTGDNPSGQNICKVIFQENHMTDNLIIELRPYNRQAMGIIAAAEAIEGAGFEINASQELNDNDIYQFVYEVTEIINA